MILLNKSKYLTSYQAIQKFQESNNKYANSKLGYVGTLDPMATGLLVVLENEENKERNKYIGLTKTYEFEILFGISTDTYDLLGIIKKIDHKVTVIENLGLTQFLGKYEQKFPPFSAKIVNGKRLYSISRHSSLSEIELPTYAREIFSLELLNNNKVNKSEVLDQVNLATKKVKGDFRQNEILNSWVSQSNKIKLEYQLVKIKAKVSSGTYIRRLCVDIANKYNVHALAYSIKRTKVGGFDIKNAI